MSKDPEIIEEEEEFEEDEVGCETGTVAWSELVTPDTEASGAFYSQLLGWETEKFGKGMDYTLFKSDGVEVVGMMQAQRPGTPPMWVPYISVVDIEANLEQAGALGGEKLMGPFPVPGVGTIAVLKDPLGAIFGLLEAAG